jgi:hypothetical protein
MRALKSPAGACGSGALIKAFVTKSRVKKTQVILVFLSAI